MYSRFCFVLASVHCDGEMFFKGTGKALLSLITRHPDEKSDCVQVAMEALHRASILGEPIRIHQRLTRYCNGYLVKFIQLPRSIRFVNVNFRD